MDLLDYTGLWSFTSPQAGGGGEGGAGPFQGRISRPASIRLTAVVTSALLTLYSLMRN